jgi:hypothetical protein
LYGSLPIPAGLHSPGKEAALAKASKEEVPFPSGWELENKVFSQTQKIKKKKKRNLSEWQIQPKKYLLEKHNLKVIKSKLEKAQRSNKLKQKTKELSLII